MVVLELLVLMGNQPQGRVVAVVVHTMLEPAVQAVMAVLLVVVEAAVVVAPLLVALVELVLAEKCG